MCYKIMISGLNGTDIEFTAKILASAARCRGYNTKIGVRGMNEIRGDMVSCCLNFFDSGEAAVSDGRPDALIAFNQWSLVKFGNYTADVIITGEDSCIDYNPHARIIRINTDICNPGARFDGLKHMIMMGVWINQTDIIDADDVSAALSARLDIHQSEKTIDAVRYGMIQSHRERMYRSA